MRSYATTSRRAGLTCKAATYGISQTTLVFANTPFAFRHRLEYGAPRFQPRSSFSSTRARQLRDIFPAKDHPHIKATKPAWPHHGYTYEEMVAVTPGHREPRTAGDRAAWRLVRLARYCMDKATGMDRNQQVDKNNPTTAVVAKKPLTEAQWVCNGISSYPVIDHSRRANERH